MIELFGWFALGWVTARGVQSLLRGRSTDREPRFTEGRTIRGNGNGGPTTEKPQFPPPRIIREDLTS